MWWYYSSCFFFFCPLDVPLIRLKNKMKAEWAYDHLFWRIITIICLNLSKFDHGSTCWLRMFQNECWKFISGSFLMSGFIEREDYILFSYKIQRLLSLFTVCFCVLFNTPWPISPPFVLFLFLLFLSELHERERELFIVWWA